MSKRFARTAVEAARVSGEVIGAVNGEVGALGHILAQQTIRVFVRATLPGTVRFAKVDLGVAHWYGKPG